MANPQKEHGHTEIANEVLEKLCTAQLTGSEFRILFFIIRKTWGWRKKMDHISLNQIARGTGIGKRSVCRVLASLEGKKYIEKVTIDYINMFGFNKDYEQWNTELIGKKIKSDQTSVIQTTTLENQTSVIQTTRVVSSRPLQVVSSRPLTKETKENKERKMTKKRGVSTPPKNDECKEFLNAFNTARKTNYTTIAPLLNNYTYWREHYSQETILQAVQGSKHHDFWGKKTLTPTIMLRRRNPNGEDVDIIGDFTARYKEPVAQVYVESGPDPEYKLPKREIINKDWEDLRRDIGKTLCKIPSFQTAAQFDEVKRRALISAEQLQANRPL